MAIYGQIYFLFSPYFGYIFSNFFIGVSEARVGGAGGSAGGASLTPMKKLGAMTGNFIARNDHILTKNDHIFLKWFPGGQKFPLMFST